MKITVRQLKQLIREATYEAMQEVGDGNEKHDENHDQDQVGEGPMMEAVKAAYRAGLRKGRSVRR